MRHLRFAFLPALAAAVMITGASVPAGAQVRLPGWGVSDSRNPAYDNGYRRGFEKGTQDVRDRRPSEYQREKDYRNADWGYDKRYGARGQYKQVFRDGFEAGYRQAYSGRGGWGTQGRQLPPVAGYPDRYPTGRDDGYGSYGGYGSRGAGQVGFNYGYNDGYERGMKAARDNKRPDPNREGWYRDGDRHYDRDYGPKDLYQRSYRDGFLQGYEAGYRGSGYYRR